jgi:hypothetical protein
LAAIYSFVDISWAHVSVVGENIQQWQHTGRPTMAASLPILLIEPDGVLRIYRIDLMVSLCFDVPESQTRAQHRDRVVGEG